MTDRAKKIDAITDELYYYMIQLVAQAGSLEEIGYEKDGDKLRSIADEIERLAIRLLNRKRKKESPTFVSK